MSGQPEGEARAEHERVGRALGLEECEPVPESYGDLMLCART